MIHECIGQSKFHIGETEDTETNIGPPYLQNWVKLECE